MLGSLIFVVLALLELAFVVMLSRATSHMPKNWYNEGKKKGTSSNAECFRITKVTAKENSSIKITDTSKEKDRENVNLISNMPPTHVVDLISFILYMLFFILFNCIYWVGYQI